MKTEAVVIGENGVAALREVDLPPITPTRVRVQTLVSGVSCGTEGDSASGKATYIARPFIAGYQAVGRIVETGASVTGLQVGDLVVTGGGGLWPVNHLFGGSHARESISEESALVKVDASTPSLSTASYAVLAAVGYEGIARMKLQPGETLLVFGLGMLGQLAGRIAQILGLRVIGINRSAAKREAAAAFGFDAVHPPDSEAIKSVGAKYAYDTTGSQQILDLAMASLAPYGELSLGSYYPGRYSIDYDLCHGALNLTLHNPVGPGARLPEVVRFIEQGLLNADPLIHHRVTPDQTPAFYADLIAKRTERTDFLGVVIDWNK